MEEAGEGRGFFCSPKLPYLNTMSQQFCVTDCSLWHLLFLSGYIGHLKRYGRHSSPHNGEYQAEKHAYHPQKAFFGREPYSNCVLI